MCLKIIWWKVFISGCTLIDAPTSLSQNDKYFKIDIHIMNVLIYLNKVPHKYWIQICHSLIIFVQSTNHFYLPTAAGLMPASRRATPCVLVLCFPQAWHETIILNLSLSLAARKVGSVCHTFSVRIHLAHI